MSSGRTDALAQAAAVLGRARRGRGASLFVRGDTGMGKTTFLDDVVAEAHDTGFTVLTTRGQSSGPELGFGSLLLLLRPVASRLDALAGDLAPAVRTALTLGADHEIDELAVRLGSHRVITSLAEEAPLLVAVDDAHLLDAATAHVLAFAVDQLGPDPVAVVVTTEDSLPASLERCSAERLVLPPLGLEELQVIVRGDGPIADEPLERCCRLAGGNPLFALELARALDADERDGRAPVPFVPRAPDAIARGLVDRLCDQPEAVRRALVVVAADDTGDLNVVRGALARLGEPPDVVEAAETAGFVRIESTSIRLAHPLWRPVAYHQVATSSRRAAHRALAAELSQPQDAAARAWQLAAAADGHDEGAASALELVADDVRRRGGPGSAARVYQRAATLSLDPDHRSRRLVAAAEAWADSQQAAEARRALEGLPHPVEPPAVLVQATDLVRRLDGAARARHFLEHARPPGIDRDGQALLDALDADLRFDEAGRDAAVAAVGAMGPVDEVDPAGALAGLVLWRAGEAGAPDWPVDVGTLDESVRRHLDHRVAELDAELGWSVRDPVAGWRGSEVGEVVARRHRGELVAAYEQLGVTSTRTSATGWAVAAQLASADIELLVGRVDDAMGRLEAIAAVVRERRCTGESAMASWLRGRAALGLGKTHDAAGWFADAASAMPQLFSAEAVVTWLVLDQDGDAARLVRRIRDLVDDAAPVIAVRRDRALAAADGAGSRFESAVERATSSGLLVEAAETVLVWAEWLGRNGDADGAKRIGDRAREQLHRLGVRLWDRRLAEVLDASGPTAAGASAPELTPAEYRVALAVATGSTNREVASKLFLSVKTVDFHLQNIYRKLGLRSRTELALRLSRDVRAESTRGTG
jgi:DNA-binding NarL/FixJ family response regulator